jgi:hypothetical protein
MHRKDEKRNKSQSAKSNAWIVTHIGPVLAGAGIDQQTHTLRMTSPGGLQERRPSALRVQFTSAKRAGTDLGQDVFDELRGEKGSKRENEKKKRSKIHEKSRTLYPSN